MLTICNFKIQFTYFALPSEHSSEIHVIDFLCVKRLTFWNYDKRDGGNICYTQRMYDEKK